MCADTYIAFRAPIGSQKDHIPVLEELDHYSLSYGTIFMVKMLHFWPKVKHRSTLYDRPSLRNKVFVLDTTKLFCFVYTTVNDIIEGISIILLHSLMSL